MKIMLGLCEEAGVGAAAVRTKVGRGQGPLQEGGAAAGPYHRFTISQSSSCSRVTLPTASFSCRSFS